MRRLIVLAALALPARLSTQAPDDRAAIEALRDSLAGVTDSVALRRLEAAGIEVAKRQRDDPLIHLRLGFIAYRLGELTKNGARYDDAAGEFEWAGELRPDWPYPWYGLGLSELARGEHAVIAIENIRQVLGKDYMSKAAQAFARATVADPSFAQAAIDVATTALAQRIQPRLQVALQAVRLAAASAAGTQPAVQLARGRVEREVGEADSSIKAFQLFLEIGGDSGLGLLELARTYYAQQRPADGWQTYFAGARVVRPAAAVALYRADLSFIAGPDELAPFDGFTSPGPRAAWLERFWLRRDVAEARNPGERLAEHYRRWFHAWRNYRLVSRHRNYDITERYRSHQSEFDDRGIIYLRHGPPDRVATTPAISGRVEPNETWLYRRPHGDLVFHFVAREDVQDFKLVESLAEALSSGFSGALALQTRRGILDDATSQLFASRSNISAIYQRLANPLPSGAVGRALATERDLGQRSIAVGTVTDSYRRNFSQPLGAVVSEFVVGAQPADGPVHQGGALHVVFAIPARRLSPIGDSGRVAYPLAFRLVVSDTGDNVVARLDTTRVFGTRQALRGGSYLSGRLALPVPPGTYRYRLLVSEPGGDAGDLVSRDSITVGALDGTRFATSDLVLGRQGSGLVWAPGPDTVPLNPLGDFPEEGSAELYYEVYGLAAGASYHTVVRLAREGGRSFLRRLFGGGQAPVFFEFDAPADGPVTRARRTLDLRDASKGNYILTVEIRDPATGESIVRRRRFVIVARQ
ncbi:MAG TPA: GWxTD domain-containing protein [Gemmatimonadales bacterium]|nr:GWxTD domain-containing protein [Gemmatimonadales bacterium]